MLAVHADWSVDPRKRWMAVAEPRPGGWTLTPPQPVGDLPTLFDRLVARDRTIALGVDLPLGLPRAYAQQHAQEANFPAFLRALEHRPEFFQVCDHLDQLAPNRPFYPARGRKGMTRAAHAAALGLGDPSGLSRACDRATAERPAGAPLFWTLGANQTGKAAISAWRDLLLPALASPAPPRLWPFDGVLHALLAEGGIVLAETYPAEALRQLGLKLTGSKRRQADRRALAAPLAAVLHHLNVTATAALTECLATGFGPDAAGEDRLDCVLGVLAVINVLAGHRPDGIPPDPWLRRWEGWVLGQTALPR